MIKVELTECESDTVHLAIAEAMEQGGFSPAALAQLAILLLKFPAFDAECEHVESENGICSDCGDEVDWTNCSGDQSVFDCNDRKENG